MCGGRGRAARPAGGAGEGCRRRGGETMVVATNILIRVRYLFLRVQKFSIFNYNFTWTLGILILVNLDNQMYV